MDSKQVVARSEGERQAVASMDHPNIAKELDAGATETGRPCFMLELWLRPLAASPSISSSKCIVKAMAIAATPE